MAPTGYLGGHVGPDSPAFLRRYVVPLLVAIVMNRKFPGRNLFRAVYFAPYVLGVAVVAVLWRYLLDNNIGLVNYYLGLLGLPDDTAWTTSTPAAAADASSMSP